MVVRISDKTQNYSKVTKLLVKPNTIHNSKKKCKFWPKKRPFQAKSGENDPFESDIFKN